MDKFLDNLSKGQIVLYNRICKHEIEQFYYESHEKGMNIWQLYCSPLIYLLFYYFEYIYSRSRIVIRGVLVGDFKDRLKDRLVNMGLIRIDR